MSSSNKHITITPVASAVPFDNSTKGFASTDTQGAIEEINNKVIASASPGFTFGRSGAVTKGSFLLTDTVPSNNTGRFVYIYNAVINKVFVGASPATTYTIEIMYHSGGGTSLTSLGTVTVTAAFGNDFTVNWSVPHGVYLCARVSTSSANQPKEVVCGLQLNGTISP